ncbi:MAG TPA: hypothetical protein VFA18_24655 [Gemmataceae bacterium]|nr:hypothetical protein [Gemmataceae bacterium]
MASQQTLSFYPSSNQETDDSDCGCAGNGIHQYVKVRGRTFDGPAYGAPGPKRPITTTTALEKEYRDEQTKQPP